MIAGRDAYGLAAYFYAPAPRLETIAYRHEVFRDLQDPAVLGTIREFAAQMQAVREHLGRIAKAHYRYEQERWFLDAAETYVAAIRDLAHALAEGAPRSAGLAQFSDHVASYLASDGFARLAADTERVKEALAGVRYRLRIDGGRVVVSRHEEEPDYGAEVLDAFAKFKQGAGRDYRFEFTVHPELNHVEAAILERVAWLHPEVFESLDAYRADHRELIDRTIARFDREVQFYVAYLEHIERVGRSGLRFCYPRVVADSRELSGREVFDLALAASLAGQGNPVVVTNDVELSGPERILVVSGPNQGGKTTFARTIGQLHHLARIGVLVPGTEARLPVVDRIFTHFERVEDVEDLSSKLESDLRRIQEILDDATADSLLIMNESFTSTTLGDQLFIGRQVMQSIIDRGVLCVVVTFLDELAALGPATVSMTSTVDPDEPARRTFRIVRRPGDGLAYAMAIAEKHRVTYSSVKARLDR